MIKDVSNQESLEQIQRIRNQKEMDLGLLQACADMISADTQEPHHNPFDDFEDVPEEKEEEIKESGTASVLSEDEAQIRKEQIKDTNKGLLQGIVNFFNRLHTSKEEIVVQEIEKEIENNEVDAYEKALSEASERVVHMDEKEKARLLKERESQIKAREILKKKMEQKKKNTKPPKPRNENGVGKWVVLGLIIIAVALFMSVKANSYWYFVYGQYEDEIEQSDDGFATTTENIEEPNPLTCLVDSISTEEDIPITINIIDGQVFGVVFGIVVLIGGIAGFFAWSNSDDRKRMRVGHEHGKGRIATPTDYIKYRKEFMDNE